MGLSFLNTALRPANEKLYDLYLNGSDIAYSQTLTSGLVKIIIDGSTINPEFYTTGGINRHLGDVEDRTLSVYKGSSSGAKSITYFSASFEDIMGVLDISSLVGLEELYIINSPDISALIFPSSSRAFTNDITLQDINSVKSIDLSGLTNLGGNINIFLNDSLEEIKFPGLVDPDKEITSLGLRNNNLQGTLDISSLITVRGAITINQNPGLQNIIWPPSSGPITSLQFYQNGLLGTLDISGLSFSTASPCSLHVANNYVATGLLLPESSAYFTALTCYNCDFEGEIDLRPITGNVDDISFQQNRITSFLMADSSYPIYSFNLSSNQLTALDVSNRMFTNSNFFANGNTSCTLFVLPDASCSFRNFNISRMAIPGVLDVSQHYFAGQFNIYQNNVTGLVWDIDKMSGVTSINLSSNSGITGVIDVSSLSGLTTLDLGITNIDGLLLPPNIDFTTLDLAQTPYLHGTLDISLLKSISNLDIANTDVSVILWPPDVSSKTLVFNGYGCNFSGTLDVSMFKNIGSFSVQGNSNLNYIVFPEPDEVFTGYGGFRAENCDLLGPLDLSILSYAYYYLMGSDNNSLAEVIWPVFQRPFGFVQWHNCSLNQQTVDGLLSNLADFYSVNIPGFNMTIYLQGGSNAVPTDGSLNVDISTLEYEFAQAGKTLTLTYNT